MWDLLTGLISDKLYEFLDAKMYYPMSRKVAGKAATISENIQQQNVVKLGIEKSAVMVLKRGELLRSEGITLPEETIIRAMEERVKQGRILTTI